MYMYHECGYPLLIESISQGDKFLTEYFDPKIKDHSEKVKYCPCCEKRLGKIPPHEQAAMFNERLKLQANTRL